MLTIAPILRLIGAGNEQLPNKIGGGFTAGDKRIGWRVFRSLLPNPEKLE